jgi:hypothetical protein
MEVLTDKVEELMMTKKKFGVMVEEAVRDLSLSYMDAILHLCDKNNIDPEDTKKYISPVIKDKLEADAIRLNFISGGGSVELPLG